MTEVEPEWDDRERMKMLALGAYEAGICDCGVHRDLTEDTGNHFTFEVRTCNLCRGTDQYNRIQRDYDEEEERRLGEDVPAKAVRNSDGRKVSVRMMAPDEVQPQRR